MDKVQYAKTANRSVVGILNEFVKQAEFWLAAYAYEKGDDDDLLSISANLAETPCSPLYKGPVSTDQTLHEIVQAGSQACACWPSTTPGAPKALGRKPTLSGHNIGRASITTRVRQ